MATGRCKHAGFTLIELLITLAIVAILVAGVTLGMRIDPLREAQRDAEAWLWQARWAAERAEREAAVYAWEIDTDRARLWRREATLAESVWQPIEGKPATRPLAPALRVMGLAVEGQALPVGGNRPPRIVFAGNRAPIFALQLSGGGGNWRLTGNPVGQIELQQVSHAP